MSRGPLSPTWLRPALVLGGASPLILAGVALIGGAVHPGYSHLNRAISELTVAGAPNKRALDAALLVMELLTVVFAVAYWHAAPAAGGRALRLSAVAMAVIGVIGLGFARYPMDPIGTPMTVAGRMHIGIVAVSAIAALVAVIAAAVGWANLARPHGLARLSWAVAAIMVASGLISALSVASGWPGVGLWQRLNTAAFGLWQMATAWVLWRRVTPRSATRTLRG